MKNWVLPDRDQLLLLQPSISEWLPEDHLARFIVEIVENELNLAPILSKYEARGRGSHPYHPSIMVALLIYGYATGTMSSRKIERATYDSVPFRFIAGGHHPDHDTIATFRRRHLNELSGLFTEVLLYARELGFLKVGTVAMDGTKVRANASKHRAVSYKRAGEIEKKLRQEVKRLMALAEQADQTPVAEGIDIPKEIARREDRIKRLEEARRAIRERRAKEAAESYTQEANEALEKVEEAVSKTLSGEKFQRPPKDPKPPDPEPLDTDQHNFTDPESRIMPDQGGFSQSYNAQLSVDTETYLAVGHHVTQHVNDKRELIEGIKHIDTAYGTPRTLIADAGYFSGKNLENAPPEIDLYISPGKTKHNDWLSDRLAPPTEEAPTTNATPAQKMRQKLHTKEGRAAYRLRKMTVEPVFGIIKQALGFRQFLLRGLEKTQGEWGLVCLGYNLKRLYSLKTALKC